MDEHQPDVVFTDVVMHGGMDESTTRQINLRYPQVLVVAELLRMWIMLKISFAWVRKIIYRS